MSKQLAYVHFRCWVISCVKQRCSCCNSASRYLSRSCNNGRTTPHCFSRNSSIVSSNNPHKHAACSVINKLNRNTVCYAVLVIMFIPPLAPCCSSPLGKSKINSCTVGGCAIIISKVKLSRYCPIGTRVIFNLTKKKRTASRASRHVVLSILSRCRVNIDC